MAVKYNEIAKVIVAILICQAAGLIGSIFTASSVKTWYVELQKPAFTPPGWLFGPVWITLYALMGIALYLAWSKGLLKPENRLALYVFIIQLVLNALWSVLFFGLKSPMWGLIGISVLWIAILLTVIKFFGISPLSGYLLLPYILWVSFAAVLNFFIWRIN